MQYAVHLKTTHLESGGVDIRVYVDCPNGKTVQAAFLITALELDEVKNKKHLIEYYERRTLSRGMVEAYGATRA